MLDNRSDDLRTNRIGVLDLPGDPFVGDLMHKLSDMELVELEGDPLEKFAKYRVILDRASYLYTYLREFLKDISLRGCYVINNPFTTSLNNKIVDLHICKLLGIPVPKTIILPDLSFHEEFPVNIIENTWDKIVSELSLPFIMKPYNGYGWDGVYLINNEDDYRTHYNLENSKRIFIVQQLIKYSQYFRVFCVGKTELLFNCWVPRPFDAGEYYTCNYDASGLLMKDISRMTVNLNTALDLDVNVIEWCINEKGVPYLIDAYNEVPDIPEHKLPAESYTWIFSRVVELIMGKVKNPGEKNKLPFII